LFICESNKVTTEITVTRQKLTAAFETSKCTVVALQLQKTVW